MAQGTRKIMTMHKALHPRNDVDRLHVSRTAGGRRLASIEDSVDAPIQRHEYIKKREGIPIIATRNNTEDTRISRTEKNRKQT